MNSDIWRNIRNGDLVAMKTLYQDCYQELYALGFRIIGDKDKVKDCLHEIFCEIWQKRANIGEVNHVKAYLKTCVRNKLLKEIKKDQKTDRFDADFDHLSESSYEQLIIAAENDVNSKVKLLKALDLLTLAQREVINLKFFDGLSYESIAILLKLKPRTVYNHMYTAMGILRKALKS